MRARVGTQAGAGRRTGGRWLQRALAAATVTAACLVVAPGTAGAAPVNPSDEQISAAEQAEVDAAAQVGQITAALAEAQSAAAGAAAQADIALQDYEDKQGAYDEARAAADAAAAAAAQADVQLQGGRDAVAAFARDSYMQGSTASGAMALMTSGGPAELIERAALLDAAGEHRTDVVAELTVLEQQATAAEQTAQTAVGQAETLKAEAATLLASAQEQKVAAREQAAALSVQQEQLEGRLVEAQQVALGLAGARKAAEEYAAAQAAAPPPAAPRRATTTADAPSSTPGAAAGPAAGTSTPAAAAPSSTPPRAPVASAPSAGGAAPAPAKAPVQAPVAPKPGGTTAAAPSGSAVQTAIAAARTQLGLPYSWGGGGSNGPSYGISPDTSIWGFDCSGLTQYAYAQAGVAIGGTSRDQWWRFRDRTVARADLKPGDLVFWGTGNDYTSIYHVALYIGGNQVIQAPQSNDVVKVSGMWFGSDYFGAVRPTG
ncbi:NlpC/P60 family protein [Modestobacter sp. SSW1-42]|uniref:C40 family peptidase n=1 Tax=Modestobacter sp. SSW1-42 TaxID=596372 RepID=UPI0039872A3D